MQLGSAAGVSECQRRRQIGIGHPKRVPRLPLICPCSTQQAFPGQPFSEAIQKLQFEMVDIGNSYASSQQRVDSGYDAHEAATVQYNGGSRWACGAP